MRVFFALFLIICCFGLASAQDNSNTSSGIGPGKDTKRPDNAPVMILSKPAAPYPDATIEVRGTVRLRVQFLESGEIGEIFAITSLPQGLTESAINAARLIRFRPKRQNGKDVTAILVVEYKFRRP
jgi:hypothetical protein